MNRIGGYIKKIHILVVLLFIIEFLLIQPVYSQHIPEPGMKIHCSYDGNWYTPEEYNIYCKPPQETPAFQSPTPSAPRGHSFEQQMQLQIFQSVITPVFSALGAVIGQSIMDLLAPTPSSPQNSYKEELLKKQQEEAKKKAIEAWKNHLKKAEEQAKQEILARQQAGQDILSRARIGTGPFGSYTIIGDRSSEREALTSINWNSPRVSANPSKPNMAETAKEQLLRTVYFSKMAETFLQFGDLEAARFYAGLAFDGGANSPIVIDYKPPKELLDAMDTKKVAELNSQLTRFSTFYRLALPKFERMQTIFTELEQVKTKKEESEKKIKEIEEEIREIEAKKQMADTPEKKAELDDILAKALALKEQAEKEYQDALQKEQELFREKQEIENKLSKMKNELLLTKGLENE